MPTDTRTCTTPRPFTTASKSTDSQSIRAPVSSCCSLDESTRIRAPPTPSSRSPVWASARDRRDHPGSEVLRREVAPHVDGDRVRYIEPVNASARAELLGAAHALLHLIHFVEPFGYSVVERWPAVRWSSQ